MRRLSAAQKEWHRRRAYRELQKKIVRQVGVMGARRRIARVRYQSARRLLPDANENFDDKPGFCVLMPPTSFDLSTNYEATFAFLMDVRGRSFIKMTTHPETGAAVRLFTDFAALRSISPGAGLVLAAEIDRRRIATGLKPRSHDQDWDPEVRAYFDQAGLFDLLGIKPQVESGSSDQASTTRAVRFVQGRSVKGQIGAALRDQLEALCGKPIGPRRAVYEAISEAIANTRHAYPQDIAIWPSKATGRWWAGGAWHSDTNVVSLQLYDQGVGIPTTLPRSPHWSDVIKMVGLADRLHPERTEARLLEAALSVGRTSTGQQGRGQGLAEMASWVDKLGNGFLRITSGRGSVTYRPGGSINGTSHRAPFFGTLIEWEIGLGA